MAPLQIAYLPARAATVGAVSLGGAIGFIGLMAPHAIRLAGIPQQRALLPLAMMLGGALLTIADTAARTVWAPQQCLSAFSQRSSACPRCCCCSPGNADAALSGRTPVGCGSHALPRSHGDVRAGTDMGRARRNGTEKHFDTHASGRRPSSRGEVELNGRRVREYDTRQRARALGVLLQIEEGTFWGTVEAYVLLGRFAHTHGWSGYGHADHDAAHAALAAVGMIAFAHRQFAMLSGGERQRVRLAQVLAQAPAVFLLDEPLQHLDLGHQVSVLKLMPSVHARSARPR